MKPNRRGLTPANNVTGSKEFAKGMAQYNAATKSSVGSNNGATLGRNLRDTSNIMNAFATEAEIEFDFNDFDASPAKLVQKYSTNEHANFLNINVMRDKKKAAKAKMIHAMEETMKAAIIKEDFKLERFKSKVRKP